MKAGLTLREAATALGVSPRTVRRLARGGLGVVRPGRRGRGCATLYDVETLLATSERVEMTDAQRDQLARGARALDLESAIADELVMIVGTRELEAFGVPARHWEDFAEYLHRRLANCIGEHLKIERE